MNLDRLTAIHFYVYSREVFDMFGYPECIIGKPGMAWGNCQMKYDYILKEWTNKEDLKKIFGLGNIPKGPAGFWIRVKRSREEAFSVADLSKILVDRKADSIIVHGWKLGYLCRTLAEQYHVYMISVSGIGLREYCFKRRFSMLCHLRAYTEDATLAVLNDDDRRLEKIKRRLKKYLRKANPRLLLTTSFRPTHIFDMILYEAAKECGIPIVFIEHGFLANPIIYEYGWRKHTILAPKWFDFYWFWNEKNRKIYTEVQQTAEERSFVLGYPLKPFEKYSGKRNMSVLFAGDRLLFDEEEEYGKYYNMVNGVYLVCKRIGIPFKFKPHSPDKEAEHISRYLLPEIEQASDFYGELRKNYIVMGSRTSALMEAGAIGNYVIQISFEPEYIKHFVWEHTWLINDYDSELEPLIRAIMKGEVQPKKLSPKEFDQPDDLLQRFNEGLERVERYYVGNIN